MAIRTRRAGQVAGAATGEPLVLPQAAAPVSAAAAPRPADPRAILFTGPAAGGSSPAVVFRNVMLAAHRLGYAVGWVDTQAAGHEDADGGYGHLVAPFRVAGEGRLRLSFADCAPAESYLGRPHARMMVPDDFLLYEEQIARLREAQAVVTSSNAAVAYYQSHGVERVHRVPNGVDCQQFHPLGFRDVPWLLREFQWLGAERRITGATTVFGCYGWVVPRKGWGTLVEAWRRHLADEPEAVLVLHTTNPAWQPPSGLPGVLFSRTSVFDVNRLLSCFDFGVFPSWYEGWGMCATECLAADVPCILPAHSGSLEYGSPDNCYWLRELTPELAGNPMVPSFRPFHWYRTDPDELGQTMLRAMRERGSRRFTPRASIAHLTWEHAARELMDVLGGELREEAAIPTTPAPMVRFRGREVADLTVLPTVVYTLRGNRERQAHVAQLLVGRRFRFVYGHEDPYKPYWASIRADFVALLREASEPFLFLEDDVDLAAPVHPQQVDYPDDADLVYLGGTTHGQPVPLPADAHRTQGEVCDGPVVPMAYTEVDAAGVRPLNMHSTHAVIFRTATAREAVAQAIEADPAIPVDVALARLLPQLRAYLLKRPIYAQSDGRNDRATRTYYP